MSQLAARLGALQQIASPGTPGIPLPFGEWLPDLPALGNPGLVDAQGVIPAGGSYKPFKGLASLVNPASQSDALNGYPLGAIGLKDTTGNAYHYVGAASKLYDIRNQSATDKSGTAYSTAARDVWEFAQYGNNVLATNYADPVQGLAIGGGGNFADWFTSTNKPKARHIATIGRFLYVGNTNDTTDGVMPNRIWWSALGDSKDMDPDSATQSDYEDLADGGAVQKIVGGVDYGVIVQETLIRRAVYTGSRAVFDINPIERSRGTPIPGSVVGHGRRLYFINEEGFMMFNGAEAVPLGHDRFDNWFWDQFDIGNAHRVFSAIDFRNKLVCWLFPVRGSEPDTILIYNWLNNRASYIQIDVRLLVSTLTQAYTLEQLDDIEGSIEDLTPSLDDPSWQGGLLRFGAYSPDNRLTYFTGNNMPAILETGDIQLHRGRRSIIENVRPLVDGAVESGNVTVEVGGRSLPDDTVNYTTEAAVNVDGVVPIDTKSERYQRVRVNIASAASWTHAQGVEVTARPGSAW